MKAILAMILAAFSVAVATHADQKQAATEDAPKVSALKKSKATTSGQTRYVNVTGSHIRHQVKPGVHAKDSTLRVNIIDPESPENKGLMTPMDMLAKNPNVFVPPGSGGGR